MAKTGNKIKNQYFVDIEEANVSRIPSLLEESSKEKYNGKQKTWRFSMLFLGFLKHKLFVTYLLYQY